MHNVEARYLPVAQGKVATPDAARLASASDAAQTHHGTHVDPADEPRRVLNLRRLVILCVAVLGLLLGVHYLHGFQMRRMASLSLTRAEAARAKGDMRATMRHLTEYLSFRRDDHETRLELTLLFDDSAKLEGAKRQSINLMEYMLWTDERELPVLRRRLAERYLEFGRYADARHHLESLAADDPQNPEWQGRIAECWIAEGDTEQASAYLRSAIRGAPREFRHYARLAEILRRDKRPEEAEQLLNDMVARYANEVQALVIRARFRRDMGRIDSALIDARRAYEQAPDDREVLLLVASLIAGLVDPGQAAPHFDVVEIERRVSRVSSATGASDPEFEIAAAQLQVLNGRLEDAERSARRLLESRPDDEQLHWLFADLLLRRGKTDAARDELRGLRTRGMLPALASYLEARIAMAEGKWLVARQHLESNTHSLSDGAPPYMQAQIHAQLALCYERLGQRERQLEEYEKALSANPSLLDVQVARATALANSGQILNALAEYQKVRDQPGVTLAIARLLLLKNLGRAPDRQDWDEVEAALSEAGANPAQQVEVLLLRAGMLAAREQTQAARDLVEQAIPRHPGDLRLVTGLADLRQSSGDLESALRGLEQAEQQFGQRLELELARVRHWVRRGSDHARRELPLITERRAALPPTAQVALLSSLAAAWRDLGEPRTAAELLDLATALERDDLRVWVRILNLAVRAADDERAQMALKEIARIDGADGLNWLIGEATRQMMLARRDGGQGQALVRARELLEAASRHGTTARVLLARAEIAELEGDETDAIERYQEAIARGERSPDVFRRAIELLYRQQRYSDAEQMIERFQSLELVDTADAFGRLAAEVLIQTRQADQALEMARRTVADSDNPADMVWLAQMLWAAGQVQEAETSLRTAIERDPEQPEPHILLVALLARSNRTGEADAAIRKVQQAVAPDRGRLAVAQCYETIGRNDEAAAQYRLALDAAPEDPAVLWSAGHFYLRSGRPADAEPLFRKLCAPRVDVPAAFLAGARRGLALLLAQNGGYPQFQEAVALLDTNLSMNGGAPSDLRVKSQILGTRPMRQSQMESLSLLLRLSERSPLTDDDQFRMVRLQIALGRWADARGAMHALLAGRARNADHLAYCIGQTLDRGELRGHVEDWIKALVEVEPESFRTVELQARRLLLMGNAAEASGLLQKWLAGEPQGQQHTTIRLRQVANALTAYAARLERSGQTVPADQLAADAERLFRQLVELAPAEAPELIRFLSRRYRLAEALDLCQQAWQTAPAEGVAAASVEILTTGPVAAEDVRRIRAGLEAAQRQHPASAQIAFQLGQVTNALGEYDAAVRWYRSAIELKPDAIAPLNDLAWLLAMRGTTSQERQEALRLINRAIELAGALDYLLETRAAVYLACGDSGAAIDDMTQAIGELATPGRQFRLAVAQHRANDHEAARRSMEQAIAGGLNPGILHPLEVPDYERLRGFLRSGR